MRYLKIALSGTALFLVYLWVSVLLNSCNNDKIVATETSDDVELLAEEIDYTEDEFEGEDSANDYTSNDESIQTDYNEETESSDYEESSDYIAGDYTSSEPAKTKLEPKKKVRNFDSKMSQKSSDPYGEFMVIAGSYLLEDNAQSMIGKLKGIGYNAEIVYFDQSQYHSICAGRYDSRSTAKETSYALKNRGIDSYVHRKQN